MEDNIMSKNELIPFKTSNIFGKIFRFLKKLFFKSKCEIKVNYVDEEQATTVEMENTKEEIVKNSFKESIRVKQEQKEKIDVKLLEQYRNGEIDEEDMTDEQYECIYNSYKEKISQLKESNQKRKEILLAYRKQMQTSN